MTVRILALVGDCYGARGGIARYNRDLFRSLAADGVGCCAAASGRSRRPFAAGIRQWPPVFSRPLYSLFAVGCLAPPSIDVVFCGHVFMAPLAGR
jgi:phosphatidylinositol alpha-1,6-mannosyltransferase